jgi:hypothetical protein
MIEDHEAEDDDLIKMLRVVTDEVGHDESQELSLSLIRRLSIFGE